MTALDSAFSYAPVTPSDSADLPGPTKGLVIGTGGTLKVTRSDGTAVALTVPAGVIPIRCTRVWSTGTAATGITALY